MTGESPSLDIEAERKLWKAVVLQALLDAAGQSRGINMRWPNWKHKAIEGQSLRWFLSAEEEEDFLNVCDMAGIDSRVIKKFAKRLARGEAEAKLLVVHFRDSFYRKRNLYIEEELNEQYDDGSNPPDF
jgi:hypothetical protein